MSKTELGPLAQLAGVWEGDLGDDVAPSDDRGTEENSYRERLTLEPFNAVHNHEQTLHGLRYKTMAWRIGDTQPFHEERGYWLWDPKDQQVTRCFIVPRGIALIAGGTVAPDAQSFELHADAGSPTYGIVSNPFLDKEFKTVKYELRIDILGPNSFKYAQTTHIQMAGRKELFSHTDQNTLKRVG